ncbi:unnamed protein product [Ilex paraguariensis]|uniref:Homeobox domain-containing protein n=1 Tax=Ilex paraguariensis TaxID=185542 RepID=A0ABC8UUX1_9AQUA
MSPAASSRWCPTPEQLMILEEMYRGGVRTPNASQIRHITSHLSSYGKIEAFSLQHGRDSSTGSAEFLGGAEDASRQMMNYTWKVDQPERFEIENSMPRTYSRDWRMLMLMDVGPTPTTPCCSKPMKTLELFPITATSLKDQCTSHI